MKTQCDLVSGTHRTTVWLPGRPGVGQLVRLPGDSKAWTVSKTYSSLDTVSKQHDAKRLWVATSGSLPIGHK